MFTLRKDVRYWWPVKVRQPDFAKPGEFAEQTLHVELRYLSVTEHDALLEEVRRDGLADPAVVPRIVTNFRDVEAADGSLVYGADTLARLTNEPGVATAIVAAYFDSRADAAKAR